MTARELAAKMIQDVFAKTGITATAGRRNESLPVQGGAWTSWQSMSRRIETGVRIAELDEMSYRRLLWAHRPLTDFLARWDGATPEEAGGDRSVHDGRHCALLASASRASIHDEELLYRLFGINAELLIDHAWGWEPVTMEQIKAYRPQVNSISSGQVLHCPYDAKGARLVVQEMADALALDLVERRLVTDQLVLTVGYDIENITNPALYADYRGEIVADRYGRKIPKHAHGTVNLKTRTSSSRKIMEAVMGLYDDIVNPKLLVRRITLVGNRLVEEARAEAEEQYEQLELFTDTGGQEEEKKQEELRLKKERSLQEAMLSVKKKYGKNAMLKGMNLQEGATAMERNSQIGGHKA